MKFQLNGTGEPLIDKTLFEKIKILRKNFPKSLIYFYTNLGLAEKNIQNKIVNSDLDFIGISLNADNAVDYKNIMKLDFKKTIKNLNNFIKLIKF